MRAFRRGIIWLDGWWLAPLLYLLELSMNLREGTRRWQFHNTIKNSFGYQILSVSRCFQQGKGPSRGPLRTLCKLGEGLLPALVYINAAGANDGCC